MGIYQILIVLLILACLGIFGVVIFSKKSQDGGLLEKFKVYATERYEFEYPSDWSVEETSKEDRTFVQLDLKQNSAKEGEIGKWLRIKAYFGSEFPPQKSYSKNMISGYLTRR